MQHGAIILVSIVFALAGCEKASEPVKTADRQIERKDQPGVLPPPLLWSAEFRDETLKGCIQLATADMNTPGVRKCKCVIEKASTTIPEQKFKTINSDPTVKEQLKQIGAAC